MAETRYEQSVYQRQCVPDNETFVFNPVVNPFIDCKYHGNKNKKGGGEEKGEEEGGGGRGGGGGGEVDNVVDEEEEEDEEELLAFTNVELRGISRCINTQAPTKVEVYKKPSCLCREFS